MFVFSCGFMPSVYDGILSTQNDTQSKISLDSIENFSQIFANFAKYGTPNNGTGLSNNNKNVNFISLSNDGVVFGGTDPNLKANNFWESIEKEIQANSC